MLFSKIAFTVVMALPLAAAEAPLPDLRVEATDGGSILFVKNAYSQPLTAFLIELVDYPGSSFSFPQDDIAGTTIAPGVEKRFPIVNMTVGAAPEYVKMRAAIYADGATSGLSEKVTQMVERRKAILETTRELIRRLEKAKSAGTGKAAVASDLNQWRESLPPITRANRNSQAAVNQLAAGSLIGETAGNVEKRSVDEVLGSLRTAERALAGSKPAL